MAQEELGQERNEAPTPQRREEARAQGQVAFSTDLTTGLMLLAAVVALSLGSRAMGAGLVETVQSDFLHLPSSTLEADQVQTLFWGMFQRALGLVGVFLGIMMVAAVLVPTFQVGFHLTPGKLGFNLDRLSPTQGWAKMFSMDGGVKGLLALVKIVTAALAAYWVVCRRGGQIASLSDAPLRGGLAQAWGVALNLGFTVAGVLVAFGVADYCFQWWRHEKQLRMTRQEVKDEVKRDEGDPQIKARIRKLQREALQQRQEKDVPRATVVVTNPTHLAVALQYDPATMGAPRVVAKGAGLIAKKIVSIARRHGVSVLEKKPLAQALFKTVKVGKDIPAGLYLLVAEVLALVYRLRGNAPTLTPAKTGT